MQSKLGIMYKTYNNLKRKAFLNAENVIYVKTKYIFYFKFIRISYVYKTQK